MLRFPARLVAPRHYLLALFCFVGMAIGIGALVPLHPARAASFDCKGAATSIEETICATPDLSKLDDALSQRFGAALALSFDPQALRTDEAAWLTGPRDHAADNGGLTTVYGERLARLDGLIAMLNALEPARQVSPASAQSTCLPLLADRDANNPCTAAGFGAVGTVDGHAIFYGMYRYVPADSDVPAYTRVAIFERLSSGLLRLTLAPESDPAFEYDTPRLIRAKALTLLEIPALEDGSGFFNRESLYSWHDRRWNDVDVTSWLADLGRRLAKGLGATRGIYPDYKTMTAYTPVWKTAGDSVACATAGGAALTLQWQGDRVALKDIHRQKAGECGEPPAGVDWHPFR